MVSELTKAIVGRWLILNLVSDILRMPQKRQICAELG